MRPERIREKVLLLLGMSNVRTEFASDLVAEAFTAEHDLSLAERVAIKDRFYWILGMRRRLEFGLGMANAHPLALYLAAEIQQGRLGAEAAAKELGNFDWQRVQRLDEVLAQEPNAVRRFGLRHSLPDWIAHRFLKELGDKAEGFAVTQNAPPPMTVRANTLRCTREELAARLAQEGVASTPGRWCATALRLDTPFNLFKAGPYRDGWFEQQDEASQLVAEIVAPPPGGRVFDVCAGAGGKTLALAALMGSKGQIIATDIDSEKLQDLKRRGRRAGVTNVRPIRVGKEEWPADVQEFARAADRILCDVPCSGLGVLRRNPDARWRCPEEQLLVLGAIQRRIAQQAAAALQPGARLIYATCSVLRAENEDVIAELLHSDPGLEVVRLAEILGNERGLPLSDPTGTWFRPLPQEHGMDGFFTAVVRRRR